MLKLMSLTEFFERAQFAKNRVDMHKIVEHYMRRRPVRVTAGKLHISPDLANIIFQLDNPELNRDKDAIIKNQDEAIDRDYVESYYNYIVDETAGELGNEEE